MNTTAGFPTLPAPDAWRVIDFISDLHLQAAEPATLAAWQHYMAHTRADAIFILGDLFEVWVGDDAAQPGSFEAQCAQTLLTASQHRAIFFMPGNRDFLVGQRFMQQSGSTLLADPTVLSFAGQRWLLTHGDALCLDDTDYMAFRAQVRSAGWQQAFLAQPLAERKAVAQGLREQSEARKAGSRETGTTYADVDTALAVQWLNSADSQHMIHGHTHRPADHVLVTEPSGRSLQRTVLSDWDGAATPARAEVLRLGLSGQLRRANPAD
jgi:UDP-2,3-diacylglucosamine hydrolase